MSPLQKSGYYLLSIFFNIYITLVILRFLFQLIKVDYYNPISQFILKATNPVLVPFRRLIPGFWGIDCAAIVLLIILQLTENVSLYFIGYSLLPIITLSYWCGLLLICLAQLLDHLLQIYTFMIFISIILSFLMTANNYNPVYVLLTQLVEPLLAKARRILPNTGMIDFSPLVVLIIFQLTKFLLVEPVIDFGKHLLI